MRGKILDITKESYGEILDITIISTLGSEDKKPPDKFCPVLGLTNNVRRLYYIYENLFPFTLGVI